MKLKILILLVMMALERKCSIEQATVNSLFKDLNKQRESGGSMLVVFYAPNCSHCIKFLKLFKNVVKGLKKEKLGLKFRKADCINSPNLIIAFRVKYFPFLVYFKKGVPRARMPLFLADYEGPTKQWVEMMHSKYHDKKRKKKKKIDDGYAFLDDLMEDNDKIKNYHKGIKDVLTRPIKFGFEDKKPKKIKAKDFKSLGK